MDETSLSFDPTSESKIIAELLGNAGNRNRVRPVAGDESAVIFLKTSDFPTLDAFKNAYLSYQQPVMCFVRPLEVPEVVAWLRDSDDIALLGESSVLTDWRCTRISKIYAERLDPLTQVHRRGQLIKSLASICRSASPQQPVSLIILDIDHLKAINDRLGVRLGDEILADLGQLIRGLCHGTLVARTRGGEFGVVVESDELTARQVASSIHRTITQYHLCDQRKITASLGVACVDECCEPSNLLSRADEALFAAKANGRNRVVCHSEIAEISNRHNEELEVISMENKAKVLSERVTSFVTQRSKRIMQSLRKEANTDGLTQLFNRRYLDKKLDEEFQHAIATGKDLCVALIDLDHFGIVNKQYGWPTGDKVLRRVADTIMRNIRNSDWVGRYGGEEIFLVMPGTAIKSAAVVCERIRSSIESMPIESNSGEPIRVTLSIGVVQLNPKTDPTVEALVERVSQLTLQAKSGGRNQVQTTST